MYARCGGRTQDEPSPVSLPSAPWKAPYVQLKAVWPVAGSVSAAASRAKLEYQCWGRQ